MSETAESASSNPMDIENQRKTTTTTTTTTIDGRRESTICIGTLNKSSVPGYPVEGGASNDDDDDVFFELDLETIEVDPDNSTPACKVSPMNSKYSYREHVFIIFCATILAFNSGFSNGVSLSGFLTPPGVLFQKQSTSGFTGVYTASALALADHENEIYGIPHVQYFGFQVSMILSFIGGSCLAAFLNPRTAPWRIAPMFAPTLFIGGIFMTIAAIISSTEAHMVSGKPHFFYFVAAANGIQNGVSSLYSANLIRTTHLTGTSTDIGLFIGQLLRGNTKNTWKLWILLGLAFSFWIGSFVSFFAVKAWTTYTLLFNAGIFWLLFLVIVSFIVTNLHLPILRALRGTWHWQRTLHRLSFRSPSCGTPKPETTLMKIFHKMDTDGDGYINQDQLYEGLKEMGMKGVKESVVKDMFRVCDRDMDGKICAKDWNALVVGENVLVG